MFRVHAGAVDYTIIAVYFAVVLGIGFAARRQVHTGLDFFLFGRTLGKGEGLAGQVRVRAAGGLGRAGRGRARPRRAVRGQGCLGGGAVVYESPQYQQLFGYTAEDATQPDFWKTLIHPDDREWVLAENERVDRTGDPWNVEYRTVTKDGRVVWLRDHAVLVRGEHGEPDYWQGYYIDITEQKQAEEALRQALDRERQALERVVENLLANAGRHTTPDTPDAAEPADVAGRA